MSPGMGSDATRVTYSGIVDERRFYSQATGHAHPLTAADYLDYPRMRAVLTAIDNTPVGALLLPSGNYDQWDVVPAIPPPLPRRARHRSRTEIGPHTVFFTNLGMLGMNVGLDVRVIDQIGLANPLAAHTARLEDARIGHDKNLFPDWAVAEGPFLKEHPYIPPYLDEDWVAQAEVALKCPATEAMLNSVRAPDGSAAVPVELHARVGVHQVPDQSRAALRTGPMRPAGASAEGRAVHRSACDGSVTDARRFVRRPGFLLWLRLE